MYFWVWAWVTSTKEHCLTTPSTWIWVVDQQHELQVISLIHLTGKHVLVNNKCTFWSISWHGVQLLANHHIKGVIEDQKWVCIPYWFDSTPVKQEARGKTKLYMFMAMHAEWSCRISWVSEWIQLERKQTLDSWPDLYFCCVMPAYSRVSICLHLREGLGPLKKGWAFAGIKFAKPSWALWLYGPIWNPDPFDGNVF